MLGTSIHVTTWTQDQHFGQVSEALRDIGRGREFSQPTDRIVAYTAAEDWTVLSRLVQILTARVTLRQTRSRLAPFAQASWQSSPRHYPWGIGLLEHDLVSEY